MGYRFSPLIYIVSEDLVLKYANAVDDSNFIHIDPARAAAGPFGGIIAPPTLASLFVLKAYRTDSVPPHGGIQLKQQFKFYEPIYPGDVLSVQAELTQKAKKGINWYLTFICHARNQKGEIVVWSESTSLWGDSGVKLDKNQNSKKAHFQSQTTAIIDPVSPVEKWKVGDSLPSLTKNMNREKIDQYEEMLGIGNPIHFDEEYARTTPFKSVIAHGLMSAAYVSESMMKVFPWEWVHHGTMAIQFLHPLRPGDTVRTQCKLQRKESTGKGTLLVFDVGCKNQHEEAVVTGTTTVQIANHK